MELGQPAALIFIPTNWQNCSNAYVHLMECRCKLL